MDLREWNGAYVKIHVVISGKHEIVEGTIFRAGPAVILLDRGKGKNNMLIERHEIRVMTEIAKPYVAPKITVRTLASVDEGSVRQHLADRHGVPLEEIPGRGSDALVLHGALHEVKLAHVHNNSPEPSAEEIDERAKLLNEQYERALECCSCGYIRLPEEDGRMFHTLAHGTQMHCHECHDPKEFEYE